MISTSPKMYQEIATLLSEELQHSGDFYNGRIEYDTEQFYSTLRCTLILYRQPHTSGIGKVVPVWWEYSICADGVEEENDFSWSEFSAYL